jgi:hypothetical protein
VSSDIIHELVLESLEEIPVVTDAVGFYKRTCMVCFDSQGHQSGVELRVVHGKSNETCQIHWMGDVTDQLRRSHADLVEATQFAACAIAFLLIQALTELMPVTQATRGTTVDYYLAPQEHRDDILIFNHTARLEVSGVLKETEGNTVDARVKVKKDRLKPDGDLPTLITVVEFSQPWAKMVEV